jgi:hypothetical protein
MTQAESKSWPEISREIAAAVESDEAKQKRYVADMFALVTSSIKGSHD